MTLISKRQYPLAITLAIIAYASVSLMGVFVKKLSGQVPASEILFFRFLFGFVFLLPTAIRGKYINIRVKSYLNMRNVAGIASMLFMFYGLKYMPVSTSIILMNTSALFVPLFLYALHGKKTSAPSLVCTLVGFLGVFFILSSVQTEVPYIYLVMGVLSAMTAALAYLGIKELSKISSPTNIAFHFHLAGSLFIPALLAYGWVTPSAYEFYLLFLVGFLGLIFQIFMNKALALAEITKITPFIFTGVLFSTLFDWIFFAGIPQLDFWIGASIILFALIVLVQLKEE